MDDNQIKAALAQHPLCKWVPAPPEVLASFEGSPHPEKIVQCKRCYTVLYEYNELPEAFPCITPFERAGNVRILRTNLPTTGGVKLEGECAVPPIDHTRMPRRPNAIEIIAALGGLEFARLEYLARAEQARAAGASPGDWEERASHVAQVKAWLRGEVGL